MGDRISVTAHFIGHLSEIGAGNSSLLTPSLLLPPLLSFYLLLFNSSIFEDTL